MAIVNNFWLKDQTKQLAGAVIYQAMGQTRSRRLAESVYNPRTEAQMNQRVKWSNLVNFYRANANWMKYAYETRKTNQSEYNKFMSLNVTDSRIFLTKQQAAAGACVVYPYLITQGSLPSIETIAYTGGWQSNIVLDDDTQIFTGMTVAQFSQNVLRNNPGIQEGDQLSFIRFTQLTNSDTGVPYVVVRKYEILIKSNGTGLLSDYMPTSYIDSNESSSDCRLVVKDSGNAGGFALILSRTIGGKTYVSSQRIVIANNAALITAYSSSTQLAAAIASYGESTEAFLSSTTANGAPTAPVANAITYVSSDGENYIPGTVYTDLPGMAGNDLEVHFAQDVTGMTATVVGRFWGEGGAVVVTEAQAATVANGIVSIANLNSDWDSSEEKQLAAIVVQIDNTTFEATFGTYQGGLE